MLRIDVLDAGDEPYAIPPDNPFVGRAGARPEILHYGLRNPFRDSVDPETGDLWIGDVGQGAWEEVDVAPAGASGLDFGWPRWEGATVTSATGCDPTGVTMPVTEYPPRLRLLGHRRRRLSRDAMPPLAAHTCTPTTAGGTLWALDAGLDRPGPNTCWQTARTISSDRDRRGGRGLARRFGGALVKLVPAAS